MFPLSRRGQSIVAGGVLAFGACVLTGSACTATPDPVTIPFTLSDGLLISVRVAADNSASGEFLVDTGAGIHVASATFLSSLQARPAGRYTGFRHTGERVDFDMFQISSLTIGSATERNPFVGRWALLDQLNIAGILSAKFFEHQPATFDFKAKQLTLETAHTLRQHARRAGIVPLGISRDRDKSLELFANFVIGNGGKSAEVECKLDTGLDGYVADSRLMPSLDLTKDSPSVTKRDTRSLFGTPETQYRTVISQIRLRERPQVVAVDTEVVFKDRLTADCLVGTRFWLDHVVTFDIENARLFVQ